jgi:multidrug efflux pump subunit AcrB
MGLIVYFIRHPTIANLLLVLMIASGLVAVSQIRAQYFPDVVISELTVSVTWKGAGADDVDRAIVQVLEPAFLATEGVTDVASEASEGRAVIDLSFETGTDITRAEKDVQSALDAITTLPESADPPEIESAEWRDRVTDVVISGPVGVDQLARFADEFVARLFAAGITRTTIQSLADPEMVVEVPSTALMQHDITMAEIAEAISGAVRGAPAGDLGDGSARVRTGTERRSPAEIEAIVLRSLPDGSTLTIGDIAEVKTTGFTSGRAAFVGENPAMTLQVSRSAAGDAIGMQATVASIATEMQASLPPDVTVTLSRTRAEQISDRLNLLWSNALSGLLLLVGILFLFLNARTAFWVAMGIPTATLAAIAVMYVSGLTLNMISMFALILILGVIVDDSIVVSEHAEFRMRELGEDPKTAAENAAIRMAGPILASTLTTVIAFFGLISIGGRFGELIADIPFTVIAVMLVSLIECFLILPNHLAHAMAASRRERWYDLPSRQVSRGMDWVKVRLIKPLMRLVVAGRYPVLAGAVVALASQAALFLQGDVQFRFFNPPEQSSISGNFSMLAGATREDSLAMMRELQRATEVVANRLAEEHGRSPVTFALSEIGGGSARSLASAEFKDADLLGGILVELINPDLRPYSGSAFLQALQDEVVAHPKLEELSFRGARFGPGGDAISVDLYGASAQDLKSAAEAMKAALLPYPEVSGLEDSLAYDKEELILNLTPQGQALGFETGALSKALRERLGGIEAASLPDGTRSSTIRVELPASELTADFLDRTLMRASSGVYVPLADIVMVERRSGFSTILRENGLQVVTVTGDLSEDDPARATEVQRALTEDIVPQIEESFGVRARLSGQLEQEREFLGSAGFASIACLVGMYLTLVWIFGHWTRPLVVMSVIPFGLVGAIFGHWIWEVPLSMFSIVGLIGMSGIIVNDSIVLVTTIDHYSRKRGLIPAIVDAVADRFRPVLLTTMTTLLGLGPLLYDTSSQAQFLKPTVITLVFGLGFGMILVLLVVPALMASQADIGRCIRSLKRVLWKAPSQMRAPMTGAVAAIGLMTVALLGPLVLWGTLPRWLLRLWPELAGMPQALTGFGLFILCATLLLIVTAVMTAISLRRRAK